LRLFGTVLMESRDVRGRGSRNVWSVKADPQVALRIKRLFPRVDRAATGEIVLVDTPEVARELIWFMDRFPMAVTPRAYLEKRAAEHREQERAVTEVLSGARPTSAAPLARPLRGYQQQAVDLALASGGLLIADDVGLGKTACGIGVISDPRARPALVVTMTHLPLQWERELAAFAPGLSVYSAKSTRPDRELRAILRRGKAGPDVYILSYSKLAAWGEFLSGRVKSVVFDEVQELRHAGSNKYVSARHVADAAAFRVGLSATPIYNYGGEIFNVIDAVRPDALGSWEEFCREWCAFRAGDKPSIRDPAAFGSYARAEGLMIRRTRAEVGRELPALTKVRYAIEADSGEIERVGDTARDLARVILDAGKEARKGQRMMAAEEFSTLVRRATGLAKARPVADFVRILVQGGEKVLLFGWHRDVYDVWAERLRDLKPAFYTGTESPPQKAEAVRRFLAGETPVLVMSLRSGAGVDGLQGFCRTAVFGELDWSPGVHEQGVGRVYRDGQPEKVIAYFLVSESGSDPVVADVLGLKLQQIEGIRDPGGALIEKLEVDGNHIRRLAESYLNGRAG
jgi:SNF2 family DNA or RNA helicase